MAELIITLINMFILFFAIGYFASGMIDRMLNKRKAQIVESLETARMSKADAIDLHAAYQEKLAGFDTEKASIIAQARERAQLRANEQLAEADWEAERIINRARKEAALKRAAFKDEVKQDMITYATAAAARLIEENMDADRQTVLFDETLREMGETTWQN